jgi:hypothetical protein
LSGFIAELNSTLIAWIGMKVLLCVHEKIQTQIRFVFTYFDLQRDFFVVVFASNWKAVQTSCKHQEALFVTVEARKT